MENIDLKHALLDDTSFEGYENDDLTKLDWPVGYYTRNQYGVLRGGLQIGTEYDGAHHNYQETRTTTSNGNTTTISGGVKKISGFWKLVAGVLNMPATDFTYNGSNMLLHTTKTDQHVGYKKWFTVEKEDGIGGTVILHQINTTYVKEHWADKGNVKIHRNENSVGTINAQKSKFYHENYSAEDINLTIESSTIANVNFKDSDLEKLNSKNCVFIDCNFDDCNFKSSKIESCSFDNCSMKTYFI